MTKRTTVLYPRVLYNIAPKAVAESFVVCSFVLDVFGELAVGEKSKDTKYS